MTGSHAATEPVFSHWVGGLRGVGAPVSAPRPFVLAGVEWVGSERARIELRALGLNRRWSRWVNASVLGHDSDGGRSPAPALFGEPVWTGPAIAVQLRSSRPVEGVTLHFVTARRPAGRLAPQHAARTDVARTTDAARAAASADEAPAKTDGGLPLATPQLDAGPGQPAIIARRAWAGDHGPIAPPEYGDVRMAFVHHSDGANGYSRAEVPAVLLSIYDYHVYVRGWNDIGYNFAIDAFGRVWEARAGGIDQAVIGAQAGGYNIESTGVVMLGTFMSVLPTAAALKTLEHVLAWKLSLHGVPVTGRVTVEVDPPDAYYTRFRPGQHVSLPRVAGHRDGCTTDCPGDDLYAHLPVVRAAVTKLAGKQAQLTLTLGADVPATGYPLKPDDVIKGSTYLTLASARIRAGDELPVAGRLLLATDAVASAPIELQTLVGQKEGTLSTATTPPITTSAITTNELGQWSAAIAPQHNLLLRALHAVAPATASPLVVIAVEPVVTLALESSAPSEQGQAAVTGTVTPAKPEVVITVHEASGHRRLIKQVTAKVSAGKFSHRFDLKPGSYELQAHTLADSENVEGWSGRVALTD